MTFFTFAHLELELELAERSSHMRRRARSLVKISKSYLIDSSCTHQFLLHRERSSNTQRSERSD